MFRLYDSKGTGRIPQHLSRNLCRALGVDVPAHSLPPQGSLKDILAVIDQRMPEPVPVLNGQLETFGQLAGEIEADPAEAEEVKTEGEGKVDSPSRRSPSKGGDKRDKFITTKSINKFMVSIGRPPMSKIEVEQMLTGMLDYDDCRPIAAVAIGSFSSDMHTWSRRANVLKDL
jgi:hypothetical protein